MELGVYTFGEVTRAASSPAERLRNLLEEIELADEVGLDVFGVGEHHRRDFAVSAPAIVLAAAARTTKRIRLSSAVTILSADDPIRVYQTFATSDLISGGRAEIMVGRGLFIESLPLFGYDPADYDTLFEEKLAALLEIRSRDDLGVFPRSLQDPLPVWIAVGGTPESAERAGRLGLPMALATTGGPPELIVPPLAALHREAAEAAGHGRPPLAVSAQGFVADKASRAVDEWFPAYAEWLTRIGRPSLGRADFDLLRARQGPNFVGEPKQIVEKILHQHQLFGHDRFLVQFAVGSLPHKSLLRSIELFGTEVAPAVRKALAVDEETVQRTEEPTRAA